MKFPHLHLSQSDGPKIVYNRLTQQYEGKHTIYSIIPLVTLNFSTASINRPSV